MSDEGNGFFNSIPDPQKVAFVYKEHRGLRDDFKSHKATIHNKVDGMHELLREIQLWRAEIRGGKYVAGTLGGLVGAVVVSLVTYFLTKG